MNETERTKREERLWQTNEKLTGMTMFGRRDEWKLILKISKRGNESVGGGEVTVISFRGLSLSLDNDSLIISIICEEPAKCLLLESNKLSAERKKWSVVCPTCLLAVSLPHWSQKITFQEEKPVSSLSFTLSFYYLAFRSLAYQFFGVFFTHSPIECLPITTFSIILAFFFI